MAMDNSWNVSGTVTTPCGIAEGLVEHFNMDICAVSIVRSGKMTNLF